MNTAMWNYPPLSLLSNPSSKTSNKENLTQIASIIEKTLQNFKIKSRVAEINVGPMFTQYAIEIASGTRLSDLHSLSDDLALATSAPMGELQIIAPIPGRSLVGIEIPNKTLELVSLRSILASQIMKSSSSKLTVALGLDTIGNPVVTDLAQLPHLLISGTTGSGKSMLLHSFIVSLLFRASPAEVRFILIDTRRLEFKGYNGIPHLLVPVISDTPQAIAALKWVIKEMERRYTEFAGSGVKNIDSYNGLAGFQKFPYIVIFIDELADLMQYGYEEVENTVIQLARMARPAGIFLIASTQKPSVDVITTHIKLNMPARIGFFMPSKIDYAVSLSIPDAERLHGKGDMLFLDAQHQKPQRILGAFVSDKEIADVVRFIKENSFKEDSDTNTKV